MASSRADVSIALLCAPGEFGDRVRESMAALGASVVYEAEPQAFDRAAFDRSQANVVVINLDARSDAELDNVYELLDDVRYRVVFNDDEVSGALTGWDQARWMRHLAAKILGDAYIDPPRPADVEAVPVNGVIASTTTDDAQRTASVAQSAASLVPEAAVGLDEVGRMARADPGVPPPASASDQAASADLIDFDAIIDVQDASQGATIWSALDAPPLPDSTAQDAADHASETEDLSGFDDVELDFDTPARAAPPQWPAATDALVDTDFDLDSLDLDSLDFDIPAGTEPTPTSASLGPAADPHFDLDALDLDAPGSAAPSPGAAAVEDLSEQAIDPDSLHFDSASDTESAFTAEAEAQSALDSVAVSASHVATPDVASPTADEGTSELAFASNEWALEDVLDDTPSSAAGAAPFGIEKLRAEEFLAPDVDVNEAHPFAVPEGVSLELIPLEEAVAPAQREVASRENWLDPDAVQPKVRKVWVLGASIGGPEAVREFLAALPRDYPALFVLAQHLGDEFVDMMAKQLAQATALTVRTPIHGARVGHGEVVIVPNGKRLLIDAMGVVVLERDTEERAFSPSIDRVLHDVADRFGSNAGAIVFSGMTDDAVEGCQYLAQKGGVIYAQSQDTCVVSTMVDGVCAAGIVKFQGSPQELADKLIAG